MKRKSLMLEQFIVAGLLGTSLMAIAPLADAQENPVCYIVNPSGEKVSLDSICRQANQSVASSNGEGISSTSQGNQQSPAQNQPYTTNLPTSYPRTVFNIQEDNLNTLSGQQTIRVQNNLRNLANDRFSPQLKLMPTSMAVRSEPSGGILVEQVAEGEWVQIYPNIRVNGSVYAETRNGGSGWIRP
jgi:hypothetical protein